MMMLNFIMPLDLQKIFINTFSGNTLLFAFISVIMIAGMAAYFRMNNLITLVMIGIFIIMFAPFFESIWLFVILLTAIATFFVIKGLTTR